MDKTTTKHTPAPWRWRSKRGMAYRYLVGRSEVPIVFLNSNWRSRKQNANARLIAAAPELLAAAKAWIDWMDSPGDGTDKTPEDEQAMLAAIRAALAKAEGVDRG